MRNKIFALSAFALSASGALAQSSVTIFGAVDLNVAHGSGSIASKTSLVSSEYSISALGFRGREDLGGGQFASFWLESGFNADTGAGQATNTNNQASGAAPAGLAGGQGITFNRRSTVGIGGNWGEIRLGRDYTPQYRNLAFEPFASTGGAFGQNLGSIITGVTSVRASNSVQYLWNTSDSGWGTLTPGVYGQAMYYFGENASNTAAKNDGTGWGVRVGYKTGPFNAAVATSKTQYNTVGASGVAGTVGDVRQSNVYGSWDFGSWQMYAQYGSDKNGTLSGKGWLIGPVIRFGANQMIRASYSRYESNAPTNPTAAKYAVSYSYDLSKRTTLTGTYVRVNNSGASAVAVYGALTAAGESSSGFALGMRHSF